MYCPYLRTQAATRPHKCRKLSGFLPDVARVYHSGGAKTETEHASFLPYSGRETWAHMQHGQNLIRLRWNANAKTYQHVYYFCRMSVKYVCLRSCTNLHISIVCAVSVFIGRIYAKNVPRRKKEDRQWRIASISASGLFCGNTCTSKQSRVAWKNQEAIKLRRNCIQKVSREALTCTSSVQNCASLSRTPPQERRTAALHQVGDLRWPGARRYFRKVSFPPVQLTCRPCPCTASACP